MRHKVYKRGIGGDEPRALCAASAKNLANGSVLDLQVHEQRGNYGQTGADKNPSEPFQLRRRYCVVGLGVRFEERGTIEKEQSEAQEEEDALKIALAAMSENHHHPEKRQQRSGSENYKLDIQHQESCSPGETRASRKSLPREKKQGNCQVQYFSCTTYNTDLYRLI